VISAPDEREFQNILLVELLKLGSSCLSRNLHMAVSRPNFTDCSGPYYQHMCGQASETLPL
jgi:hypothetical protein